MVPAPDVAAAPIPWRIIAVILLLALGLRIACWARAPLVGTDTYRYLLQSERFERGDFTNGAGDPYHPLTSFVIAKLNQLQGSVLPAPADLDVSQARRERAAHFLVMLAGLLVVFLSMDLCRRHFPGVSPIAVGIAAAAQPYFVRSSSDIMSDTPFLALFLLALREGSRTRDERSWFTPFVVGGLAGLAYLTRPEGVVLLPVLGLFWCLERPMQLRALAGRIGLFGVGAALLILPYMQALRLLFGRWTLTAKKDVHSLLGIAAETSPDGGSHLMDQLQLMVETCQRLLWLWFTTSPEALAAPAVIGLGWMIVRREWSRGKTLFAMIAVLMILILLRVAFSVQDGTYLSRRHVFLLVALTLPFSIRGAVVAAMGISRLLRGRGKHSFLVLFLVMLSAMVPKAVSPQRNDQLAQKEAGRFIYRQGGSGEQIFTLREKVAYYSGGRWRDLLPDPERLIGAIKKEPRAWLVFYLEKIDGACPGLRERLARDDTGLKQVRVLGENSRRVRTLVLYLWEQP